MQDGCNGCNILEFSCSVDFCMCIFKTIVEYGFLKNPPVEWTLNSMEQKTWVFWSNWFPRFYLWALIIKNFNYRWKIAKILIYFSLFIFCQKLMSKNSISGWVTTSSCCSGCTAPPRTRCCLLSNWCLRIPSQAGSRRAAAAVAAPRPRGLDAVFCQIDV